MGLGAFRDHPNRNNQPGELQVLLLFASFRSPSLGIRVNEVH